MSSNYLLKIIKPIIPNSELIKCEGSESLSESFKFDLTFYVFENSELNKQDLIGQPISFQIKKRLFNGLIWCYEKSNQRFLKLTVVSRFWFLKLSSDCCIFRRQTVPDIFKQVCKRNNICDFDLSALKDSYPVKNYIVQYNETDFDFLSRILNDSGISYYFAHEPDRHLMRLCDQFFRRSSCMRVSCITAWRRHLKEQPSRAEVIGYDYRRPNRFRVFSKGNERLPYTKSYYLGDCSDEAEAQREANRLFFLLQNQSDFVEGKSQEINFSAGGQFEPSDIENIYPQRRDFLRGAEERAAGTYAGYVRAASDYGNFVANSFAKGINYFLMKVQHKAFENARYNSAFSEAFYENQFTAIPISADFEARRFSRNDKRRVIGVQSAQVIGPDDGEPFTDRMGRVKVRFFWEHEKNNPCETGFWIRAAQPLASSGFGVQFLPRAGDEVFIGFIRGNPDNPIILGSFYNRANTLPYSQNQSGFKSDLIAPHIGKGINALWVDDTPSREKFNIQAAQNFSTFVREDENTVVEQSYRSKISGSQSVQSRRRIIWKSGETISFSAGGAQIILEPDAIQIKGKAIDLN